MTDRGKHHVFVAWCTQFSLVSLTPRAGVREMCALLSKDWPFITPCEKQIFLINFIIEINLR